MAHRGIPRKIKAEQRLITTQQADNVLAFPGADNLGLSESNMLPKMSKEDIDKAEDVIDDRYESARAVTDAMRTEINRAEKQFRGLFPDQEEGQEFADDDIRIFMRKTMEQIQVISAHLDTLSAQLDPIVTFSPEPRGLFPPSVEVRRAKGREILVNEVLRRARFKRDVVPRWRMNFLKHPSAFVRVVYDADAARPDLRIEVKDRGNLYLDPLITTGSVRDGRWLIEKDFVTQDEAQGLIDEGFWYLPGGIEKHAVRNSKPDNDMLRQLLGRHVTDSQPRGADRDEMIEVWHYWQRRTRGQPHVYAVRLGGASGQLVRWGGNPYPYKGIPYSGKSYMRHTTRVDGVSLVEQYRSIQEIYNTIFNLRIADVTDGVKKQALVFDNLFDQTTHEDVANNQRFLRLNKAFLQQMMQEGRSINDFVYPLGSSESTQHLLQDLQYIDQEGRSELSSSDVFRGGNPQSGATLGQFQEQLTRAVGVFRPVYSQEIAMYEEVAEIVNEYFNDPAFFGEERIAAILGPNRYKETVPGFQDDEGTGLSVIRIPFDEMDVDVTIDAMNAADHAASRTLRLSMFVGFLDALRHHPSLVEEAQKEINFNALFFRFLQEHGEDIEAITFTEEEKAQRAEQREQSEDDVQEEELESKTKLIKALEGAKGQREISVVEAKIEGQRNIEEVKQDDMLDSLVIKIAKQTESNFKLLMQEHRNEMAKQRQEHLDQLTRMSVEQVLEIAAQKQGVKASIQSGGDDINTDPS